MKPVPGRRPAGESEPGGASGWTPGDVALSVGSLVVFLGAWELGVLLLQVPPVVLPPPSRVADSLWALLAGGVVWRHLGITVIEILIGFLIGASSGLVLGSLIAEFRVVDRVFYPGLVAFQSVPKVALAPLLVIWFGFGLESKIMMTALISFFPILVNTAAGLRTVDRERLELMAALAATRWQTFRFVRLPSALPFIFAGLDIGIVLSVIGAIVGEFVGSTGGLGHLLQLYNAQLNVASVFAVLAVLGALGVVLHSAVGVVQRRFTFWAEPDRERFSSA